MATNKKRICPKLTLWQAPPRKVWANPSRMSRRMPLKDARTLPKGF